MTHQTDSKPQPVAEAESLAGAVSSKCVLTRDLKGRLGIQSAPEVFLCARVSIQDLIDRHNELIRERDEARAMADRLAKALQDYLNSYLVDDALTAWKKEAWN
jgi:hypothetical protein